MATDKVELILPRTEAELRQQMEYAEQALRDYDAARVALVEATDVLAKAEGDRAKQKIGAVSRLMATGVSPDGKPFSLSRAEDYAQLDPEYAAYKARITELTLAKMEAEHALESARLTATYAEALVRRAGGLT
jgi:hypothetical protein